MPGWLEVEGQCGGGSGVLEGDWVGLGLIKEMSWKPRRQRARELQTVRGSRGAGKEFWEVPGKEGLYSPQKCGPRKAMPERRCWRHVPEGEARREEGREVLLGKVPGQRKRGGQDPVRWAFRSRKWCCFEDKGSETHRLWRPLLGTGTTLFFMFKAHIPPPLCGKAGRWVAGEDGGWRLAGEGGISQGEKGQIVAGPLGSSLWMASRLLNSMAFQ